MRVFDVTAIAQFYFRTDADYGQMKADIRTLNYLRLLILEDLQTHTTTIPAENILEGCDRNHKFLLPNQINQDEFQTWLYNYKPSTS